MEMNFGMRRLRSPRAARLSVATVTVALLLAPSALAADRLPDLGMARLSDLRTERTADGRRLLRYTTVIVNVGAGAFEARGYRASTSEPEMTVSQRIYGDGGTVRDAATPARMFFAGDGHTHWHVRDLEVSELIRLDNGVKVGTGAKRGFCFFDNYRYRLTLAGAPQSPVYTGCGSASNLQVTMGVSIGWGDAYYYNLPDQYLNITGLSSGRYRLKVTADAQNWFTESNNANNVTWVDIQLKHNSVRVTGYGPAA